ncbi:hypothetical protein [Streptomyces sp. NPDC058657]|uniref:hypothetical protein n=1 Tax=unclassified Streptomyces TaxID=2593676 RepID=UPI003660FB0A
MARHSAPKSPRRALLRAGLTVTAVGAALAAGAGAAQAAPAALPAVPAAGADQAADDTAAPGPAEALTGAFTHGLAGGLGPAQNLRLDPLAGTAVDPLGNAVGTQVADFQPLSTGLVTGPLASGGALKDLPLANAVTDILPG